MAAANESQGLKIAVAVFVMLTVIFAVTTYFGFSNYSQSEAKLADANIKNQGLNAEYGKARTLIDYLKQRAGYAKHDAEDPKALHDSIEEAIKKDDARLNEQLTTTANGLQQLIAQYRSSGGGQEKVNELSQAASQLVAQVASEPNKTYQSEVERLMALVDNMAKLSTTLSLDNEELRKSLTSVDEQNAKQLQVEVDELNKAKDDLMNEHDKHEMDRQALVRKNDELNTVNSQQATEIARLNQQISQMEVDFSSLRNELLAQVKFYREQVEKRQEVMDVPDGKITYVDYNRGEVTTNLNRSTGAHERLQLSVFDRNSPGLPTDKPKALIELIRVTDVGSTGRIIRTNKPSDPIRLNDHVYSAAWSPNNPLKFALIGPMHVSRSERDDRKDLYRLIQAAGGEVVYDLPPSNVGQEFGKLSPLVSWYVIDDRGPFRPKTGPSAVEDAPEDKQYLERKTQALRDAHLYGVRPISIDKLLAMLGYKYGTDVPGRAEAVDREAVEQLLRHQPQGAQPSGNAPETEAPQPAAPGGEAPAPAANEPAPAGAFPN